MVLGAPTWIYVQDVCMYTVSAFSLPSPLISSLFLHVEVERVDLAANLCIPSWKQAQWFAWDPCLTICCCGHVLPTFLCLHFLAFLTFLEGRNLYSQTQICARKYVTRERQRHPPQQQGTRQVEALTPISGAPACTFPPPLLPFPAFLLSSSIPCIPSFHVGLRMHCRRQKVWQRKHEYWCPTNVHVYILLPC